MANIEFRGGKGLQRQTGCATPVWCCIRLARTGKQARGGLELKSDANGKASFDGVPYGKLRIQVLAPGFQTFGEDYDVDKPEDGDHDQVEASDGAVLDLPKTSRTKRSAKPQTSGRSAEVRSQIAEVDGPDLWSSVKILTTEFGEIGKDQDLKTEDNSWIICSRPNHPHIRLPICSATRSPSGMASPIHGCGETSARMKPGERLVIYETGDHKSAVGTASVVSVEMR